MSTDTLDIKNLTFSYGKGKAALHGIGFCAGSQESIGLIGANGAGKSTLLKLMVGLLEGYEGTVKLNQLPVVKKNLAAVREKTGYVFQDSDSQLFMTTVLEDVAFAPRNYGYSESEVKERADRALQMVHMEAYKDAQIYRLSGGQKKLVSIATILSTEPSVILLDEPSAALDPRNRRNLIQVLNGLGGLKIIASHDLDFVYDTCGRSILLSEGKIIKDGSTKEILSDSNLLEENGLELPLSMMQRPNLQGLDEKNGYPQNNVIDR